MDEPTTPAPEQAPDTPEGTGTPETNWQERYEHLQPEYTRATQQLSRYEKDEEFQRQHFQTLAEKFGYQLEEETDVPDTDEPEFVDPVARQQLEALQQQLQQAQEAQQYQQMERSVNTQFDKLGITDQSDQELLLLLATKPGAPSKDGMPDIEAAYKALTERDQAAQKRWAQTKRAPHIPSGGQAGTQVPDLDDPQQRVAHMAQRWADAAAQ